MARLTEQGLVTSSLPEIIEEINAACRARLTPDWDSSSNNVINILTGIYADRVASIEEGLQGCYDANYPKTAARLNLDNAVAYANIRRIPASKTYTALEVTGIVGTVFPEGTIVDGATSEDRFTTTEPLTLSSSQFSDITINVTTVLNSTNYTVSISSNPVTINSGVGATANSILTALAGGLTSTISGITVTQPTSTTLRIDVTEVNSVLPIVVGSGLGVTSVSDLVSMEANASGAVIAPANTLTNLPVPVSGITGVTNRASAVVGRLEETDTELRVRRYESVGANGGGTFNAIYGKVGDIAGVEFITVAANSSASTDSNGVPSKAFEVVVFGGDDDTIAKTIFDNTPIGIESFGSVSKVVIDTEGNPQVVRFSRPTDVFLHVQATYKDYSEELVSVTNSTAIKNAILTYGNTLPVGKDVIPQRFLGSIYTSTTGVGEITLMFAKSYDGVTLSPYTSSIIPMDKRELPTFRDDLISVTRI